MKLKDILFWIGADYRAWKAGDRRIAPWGSRGRIYAPDPEAGKYLFWRRKLRDRDRVHRVVKTPSATLKIKVTRADGTVEDHGVHPVSVGLFRRLFNSGD